MPGLSRHTPAIAPPPLLLKWQTWVLGLVVMLVPFFIPIPMVLRRHPIISPLGDQLHVVLLAGIALLLYWRGPLTGRLWFTALVAAVIGATIEFVQIPFGRSAHYMDFLLDLVGIGLIVGFVLWRGHHRKVGLWLMLALLLVPPSRMYHVPFVAAAAYRAQEIFPVIADLEGSRDHWLWGSNHSVLEVVEIPDSPSGPGRVVRMAGGPPAYWPGVEIRRFPHDWSDYEHLVLAVRVVSGETKNQRFAIRCDDFFGRKEETWITTSFTATDTWQTFRVPLRDRQVSNGQDRPERLFDRQDVDRVLLYLPRPEGRAVLEIDDLRLE
jgi:hypothetical protein